MKLGVDFGTTRIVVAAVDRGNYPILRFETPEGTADWFPPLVALRGAQQRFGWDAWTVQGEPGWTVIRSLKRVLADAGPDTCLDVDGARYRVMDLLTGLITEFRRALGLADPQEVMLGVPANANGNQRFLTIEAFQRAGFQVLGLLNEPSAAAIEFGHSQKLKGRLLVYDLGGGTFDASLVDLDEQIHTVVASEGSATIGGDEFDHVLADMALAGRPPGELSAGELFRLLEECRRQKEGLHPNTRKLVVDLDHVREGWGQVAIPVSAYYERCRPLIEETIGTVSALLGEDPIEALYITGGGSELPLVARRLREAFGRRVRRSAYTRSATAIGLAIQADAASGYTLHEVFTRNFGVWREGDGGRVAVFDVIFPRGTRLPIPGESPLAVERRYRPVHNVGYFRYLEASQLGEAGQPAGDIAVWDEVWFPLDPALAGHPDVAGIPVERSDTAARQQIDEHYTCHATGTLAVTIRNLTAHYAREYTLARWSSQAVALPVPTRRRRRR
jgi:molecular chaperone DnaK (HSP70)